MPVIQRIRDIFRRKQSRKDLEREHATTSAVGVRRPYADTIASGISPERLADVLRRASEGENFEYLTLAEEIEEREPHYGAVLTIRKLAILGLPVTVAASSEKRADVKMADLVREKIVEQPAFKDLQLDLLDGVGKGYSVCEIMWDTREIPWCHQSYNWVDPRHFQFDRETLSEIRLRDEADPINGILLAPYKFAIHRPRLRSGKTLRAGLTRTVAALHCIKSFTAKHWMIYAEVFGMPFRVGKYDQGATQEDIRSLKTAIREIGTDAGAVVPDGMVIEFVEASRGSHAEVHEKLCRWIDQQTSKVVLGQTMTTDDGSSLAQAQIHADVRHDVRDADAWQLSVTINRDVVRPWIDLNYGPPRDGKYPIVLIAAEEVDDLVAIMQALSGAIDRGMPIEYTWLADKFSAPTLDPVKDGETLVLTKDGLRRFAEVLEPPRPPPIEEPGAPEADGDKPESEEEQDDDDGEDESDEEAGATAHQCVDTAASRTADTIDREAERAADEWEPILSPIEQAVSELAAEAKDFDEFRSKLKRKLAATSLDRLIDRIAEEGFKARGMGDATDEV